MNKLKLRNRLKSLRHLAQENKHTQFLELSIKTRKELDESQESISKNLENAEDTTSWNDRQYYINEALEQLK